MQACRKYSVNQSYKTTDVKANVYYVQIISNCRIQLLPYVLHDFLTFLLGCNLIIKSHNSLPSCRKFTSFSTSVAKIGLYDHSTGNETDLILSA